MLKIIKKLKSLPLDFDVALKGETQLRPCYFIGRDYACGYHGGGNSVTCPICELKCKGPGLNHRQKK